MQSEHLHDTIGKLTEKCNSRIDFWIDFVNTMEIETMAEIGVYRGDFAEAMLTNCPKLRQYIMVDPWAKLDEWNKPTNVENHLFEQYYAEVIQRTDFAKKKRVILRGTTVQVIDRIPDHSLDLIYIDGDHTLKGISIDLLLTYPKVKSRGFIAGDDFCPSIWQHNTKFEPSFVFPYAVYFAQATTHEILALRHDQFLISKSSDKYIFGGQIEKYYNTSVLSQCSLATLVKRRVTSLPNEIVTSLPDELKTQLKRILKLWKSR